MLTFVSGGPTIAVLAMQLLQHNCRAGNLKLEFQELSAIKKNCEAYFPYKVGNFQFQQTELSTVRPL